MNKFILIFSLMILVFVLPASAELVMCAENPDLGVPCTFVTPTIADCVIFNYTIQQVPTNLTIEQNLLTPFGDADNQFQLDFVHVNATDNFLITLCEGTTREVRVGGDNVVLSLVTGQVIFFIFFAIAAAGFLGMLMHFGNPVFGFLSSTSMIITGYVLLTNPFQFVQGTVNFIGMQGFGLALIVFAIWILFKSGQAFFDSRKPEQVRDDTDDFFFTD